MKERKYHDSSPHQSPSLLIHDVDREDADGVVGLHRARGAELVEGTLGHAGKYGRHRVVPPLKLKARFLSVARQSGLQYGASAQS